MAKLRKGIRIALKTLGVIIAILALATLIIANSSYVQKKLVSIATDALSKQLETEVCVEHVGLNLLNMSATIEGILLKDQQQRDMLKVKRIWGRVQPLALLRKEIRLRKAEVDSIEVHLIKPEDGPANYQFLLDSSKKDNRIFAGIRSTPSA